MYDINKIVYINGLDMFFRIVFCNTKSEVLLTVNSKHVRLAFKSEFALSFSIQLLALCINFQLESSLKRS